jgi:hypothetical protein
MATEDHDFEEIILISKEKIQVEQGKHWTREGVYPRSDVLNYIPRN